MTMQEEKEQFEELLGEPVEPEKCPDCSGLGCLPYADPDDCICCGNRGYVFVLTSNVKDNDN